MLNKLYNIICELKVIIFVQKFLAWTETNKYFSEHIMRSIKETHDTKVIDAGVQSILEFGEDGLFPHFIYCGDYYVGSQEAQNRFLTVFLTKMKKIGIEFAVLTMLTMWRRKLVTKETVKLAYKGKLRADEEWNKFERSINDDLETFFINLQNRKIIKSETVGSFFTPNLTEEEIKLVEGRNEQHLSTYLFYCAGINPEVDIDELKRSDSRSIFVQVGCSRTTMPLKQASKRKIVDN